MSKDLAITDDDLNFEVLHSVEMFGDSSSLMVAMSCMCSSSTSCTCTSSSSTCFTESA